MKTMQRFRVVFEFEARDEREAIQLISCPDILRAEAEMRIENVSQRLDLRNALLLSPLLVVAVLICYSWWGW